MVQESQDRQFQDVQSTSPSTVSPGAKPLGEVQQVVRQVAQGCQGNPEALLDLLRLLEALHREICEQEFRPALPDTRRALYSFLREIEAEGGWPYIPRMRLKTLLAHLEAQASELSETQPD
ncbi:hypothetical protein AY600_00860 [Phormidium willei BDU 130791]|nr:hypothetical protein AY600_00860 [Phormidium willei BDU 130791]